MKTLNQKNFLHVPVELDLPKLNVREINGREYQLPSGVWVPSITTVLSFFEREHIESWRNLIGHHEADVITKTAIRRGENLHKLCEIYLNNEPLPKLNPIELQSFRQIRKLIDRVDYVVAQEVQLYSTVLGIAGRTDTICSYECEECVLDFKTSRSEKGIDRIEHYFEQTAGYAEMWWERTGKRIDKLVVIVESLHDNDAKVWVSTRSAHLNSLVDKIQKYKESIL